MDSRPRFNPAIVDVMSSADPSTNIAQTALALAKSYAFVGDENGALILDNAPAFQKAFFLGALPKSLDKQTWESWMTAEGVRARRHAYKSLNWSGAQIEIDYSLRDGQGGLRHIRERVQATDAPHDRRAETSLRRIGVMIDRTETVAAQERQLWASRHDPVTHLENKAAFTARVGTLAALATRAQFDVQLLRLRVSNLNDLESVYGINYTERLVVQLARRLEDAVRAPDAIGRLDVTDFGLCVIGQDVEGLSERLHADIGDTPYSTAFGPISLKIELTTMRLPAGPEGVGLALENTQATLDGRPIPAAGPKRTASTDIIAALENDLISLAFQPIICAKTGAVHHHECLLRLRSDDGRMISAGAIVQDAERLGLISQLDERALHLARPHLQQTDDLHLALNVSAGTLGDPKTADRYLNQLKDMGPLAKRITIEMTETVAVDDPGMAARFSAAVRALGCEFAVDDFGSGYTTFRNLMAVEADSLKIDGSLIKGIATDENKQTFMRMMVDLAQTVGVKTVAEMVESEADAAILCRLGTDYLQGYHFGRPAPAPVWSRLAG